MANTTLQVKIYQAKNNQSTFTGNISDVATTGVIVFDEYTQKIGINKKWFGIDDLATYNTLKTTVRNLSTKVGNDSVAAQISNALETALGTLTDGQLDISSITLGANVEPTVENYLKALQAAITTNAGAISTANTNISNLQTATKTDSSSLFVVRDKTAGNDHTDFATTTAIQTAIDTAESDAKTFATNADTTLKSNIEGTSSKTIPVTSGSGEQATTTNVTFDGDRKSIGYLWDRVSDAFAKIDTLGGTDLAAVQNAITAIKHELNGDDETTSLANTLIDKLSTFLGGVTSWDADGDNSTNNATTVADIISQLQSYAASQASTAQSTVVGASGDASNANTVYGAKAYADSLIAGLDLQTALSQTNNGVTVSINQANGLIKDLSVTAPANTTTTTTRTATQADNDKIALSGTTTEDALIELATAVKSAQSTADSSVSWTVVTGNESGN